MEVQAEPRYLSLGQLKPGEKAKAHFSLSVEEPEVKITSVKALDERFEVERTTEGEYEVRFEPDEVGRASSIIRVEYVGGKADHVDIPVSGAVVGDLVYPRQLTFQRENDAIVPQTLRVTTRSGEPVRVISVRDPDGRLSAKLTKPAGKTAEIELEVREAPTKYARGTLEVKTTDRFEPTVSIGYYVYGEPPKATARRRAGGGPASSPRLRR